MNRIVLTAFLDVLFCTMIVLLAMVNPAQKEQSTVDPPGTLMIYTAWPDKGSKNDVDTWVFAPGMNQPIGYDNKEGADCNLVKDDLGWPGEVNFENVYCRNTPDGEYIFNIHAYQTTSSVPVEVQIMLVRNGKTELLFNETITLSHNKEEVTVIRFYMKDGQVVKDSINHVFVSLYKPKPNGGF